MSDESNAAEETKQRVQGYLQGLKPIHLEGAPKVSARWSGTLINLKAENRLGKGSFGEVWAISRLDMPLKGIQGSSTSGSNTLDHVSHAMFAVKMLRKFDTSEKGSEQSRSTNKGTRIGGEYSVLANGDLLDMDEVDEARLVMSLRHHHVVKCYGAFQNKYFVALFYEYGRGGDVNQLLRERGKLTREEALSITWQILDATKYLHKKGIIHRDIKPRNIFYKYDRKWFEDKERDKSTSHEVESRDKYLVFLGDFGLAVDIEDGKPAGCSGTMDYMAPEVLRAQDSTKYDAKIDLWSLGMTAYKLMTANKPHFDRRTTGSINLTTFKNPDDGSMNVPLANYLEEHIQDIVKERFDNDSDVRDFLQGCLTIDPQKRNADVRMLARARSSGRDFETRMRASDTQNTNDKRKGIREGFNPRMHWKAAINVNKAAHALQQGPNKQLKNLVSNISIQDTSKHPQKSIKSKKVPDTKDV